MIKIEYRSDLDFNHPNFLTFNSLENNKKLSLIGGINWVESDVYKVFENTDYFKNLVENKILLVEKEPLVSDNKKSKLPPIED